MSRKPRLWTTNAAVPRVSGRTTPTSTTLSATPIDGRQTHAATPSPLARSVITISSVRRRKRIGIMGDYLLLGLTLSDERAEIHRAFSRTQIRASHQTLADSRLPCPFPSPPGRPNRCGPPTMLLRALQAPSATARRGL